jgi:3-oxoacyl-[acyl-carrier-protein] synthase III
MARALIVGSGSQIPPNRVTYDMLGRVMDVSDEWIRERSGVETRYCVEDGTSTSDLGAAAAEKALAMLASTNRRWILNRERGMRYADCFSIRPKCD